MITNENSYSTVSMHHILPPAQLLIGQHEHVIQEVEIFLQKILCPHKGCQTCHVCMQIRDKQHHSIIWFYPDKTYTIDQLETLFTTIAYALQPNEKFFFIIQKADFLSTICANKLLKPMEEPPTGYHFILLAEHIEHILPTIISRCTIHTLSSKTDNYGNHLLFKTFTTNHCTITEFSKIIDSSGVNERETVEIFNEILGYWLGLCNKNAPDKQSHLRQAVIMTLKSASKHMPMPGSSIIFWRNLYLNFYPIMTALKQTI